MEMLMNKSMQNMYVHKYEARTSKFLVYRLDRSHLQYGDGQAQP